MSFEKLVKHLGFKTSNECPRYVHFDGTEKTFEEPRQFRYCLIKLKKMASEAEYNEQRIDVYINGDKQRILHGDSWYSDIAPWLTTWCNAPYVPLDYYKYGILGLVGIDISSIRFSKDVECYLVEKDQIESTNKKWKNRWRKFKKKQ